MGIFDLEDHNKFVFTDSRVSNFVDMREKNTNTFDIFSSSAALPSSFRCDVTFGKSRSLTVKSDAHSRSTTTYL